MRLTRIRLHPFGHFVDQTWDLDRPVVVVCGPNEQGKTTLRQAIVQVLFTPTKITKTKVAETVGPWFPLPAGDYAEVTLTFEHAGTIWTLAKRWGVGQESRLSNGTNLIADPATVQARLGEILEHGEATFRHVLFTGQAELEQTLAAIKRNADQLRDVRDLLHAAAGAAADVDEQHLRRLLEERIDKAFSRWDDRRGRPERQGGQEKVGGERWKRAVGEILAAWYAWQDLEAERHEVLAIESEMDRLGLDLSQIEDRIRDRDAFVNRFGGLRSGLSERGELEERIKRLTQDVATLQAVFHGWPVAQAGIDAWSRARPDLIGQLTDLRQELGIARTRLAGMATIQAFERVEQARKTLADALAEAAKEPPLSEPMLCEIQRLERSISDAENRLAAKTLAWRLDAELECTAVVVPGERPPETVRVDRHGSTGTAQGRVSVSAGGVRLTVVSGEDEVEDLLRSLTEHRCQLAQTLASCSVPSPEAARLVVARHRDDQMAAANARQVYEGLLLGKSFEQWQEEVRVISALPLTRAIAAIEQEIDRQQERLSAGEAEAKKHVDALAEWAGRYADHASVGRRLLAEQAAVAQAEDRLRAVPSLPDGFETADALLSALDRAQAEQTTARDMLTDRRTAFERLLAQHADRRGEDLAERAEIARRTFERVRAQGRSYLRIREVLDRIVAGGDNAPLVSFHAQVADRFSRITGRVADIIFDGPFPTHVNRGDVSLPPERLSHGGAGALALALRLAMAEAYLEGGTGFIMLDDPLVHLDADRMAVAVGLLREFSARWQVIFFTCHDHHAARLTSPDRISVVSARSESQTGQP
jgi:exonuclease SbcC